MTDSPLPAGRYARLRRARMMRALLLAVGSGGTLVLLAAWRVLWVARRASTRSPGSRWVLVPGCMLDRGEIIPAHARRLRRALRLWQRDTSRRLLLSGAAEHPEAASEAEAGLGHLCDLGLPDDVQVLLDVCARDTEENLLGACRLLRRDGDDARAAASATPPSADAVVVVSNRWHLARCGWLLREHGLRWRVCAAEARWQPGVADWCAVLREALGLLALAGAGIIRLDPDLLLRPHR